MAQIWLLGYILKVPCDNKIGAFSSTGGEPVEERVHGGEAEPGMGFGYNVYRDRRRVDVPVRDFGFMRPECRGMVALEVLGDRSGHPGFQDGPATPKTGPRGAFSFGPWGTVRELGIPPSASGPWFYTERELEG